MICSFSLTRAGELVADIEMKQNESLDEAEPNIPSKIPIPSHDMIGCGIVIFRF